MDGSFWRFEARMITVIVSLLCPRPLPFRPLPDPNIEELVEKSRFCSELIGDLRFLQVENPFESRLSAVLSRNGVIAIVAAVSPYRAVRLELRQSIENFVEVHADCPLGVLIARDGKGLYR